MRWFVWLPLALIALAGVVFLLGALRPAEHEASVEASYGAPVDQVWDVIRAVEAWPAWHPELESVEPDAGRTAAADTWRLTGGWGSMRTTITSEAPPRRLVTFSDADGFSGEWTYELRDRPPGPPAGTTVRITERGRVPSAFFRGVMTLMRHDEHASMEAFLRGLGAALGETPEIVRHPR